MRKEDIFLDFYNFFAALSFRKRKKNIKITDNSNSVFIATLMGMDFSKDSFIFQLLQNSLFNFVDTRNTLNVTPLIYSLRNYKKIQEVHYQHCIE